jgi:putative endonuclease
VYYFYVLQSKKDGKLYFGYSNDLRRHVREHNEKRVQSTKARVPLMLIYYEAYRSEADARKHEIQIKRRANAHIGLVRRIKGSLIAE